MAGALGPTCPDQPLQEVAQLLEGQPSGPVHALLESVQCDNAFLLASLWSTMRTSKLKKSPMQRNVHALQWIILNISLVSKCTYIVHVHHRIYASNTIVKSVFLK